MEYLQSTGELTGVQLDEKYVYASGHKKNNNGFFIDATLKENLDNYLVTAVDARWDGISITSGMEGCLCDGGVVLMANGEWKDIKSIEVGDMIMSPQLNGSYRYSKVLKTFKWKSKNTYSINEANRKRKHLFKCSYNHGLAIYDNRIKNINEVSAEYFFNLKSKHRESMITAPLINRFMGREDCKIEPYTLGVFLGDGSFTNSLRITNSYNDREIIREVKKFYKISGSYKDYRNKNVVTTYTFKQDTDLYKQLIEYNLRYKRSKDKFIPKDAMLSDMNYRIRLLSGLFDTDGSIHKGSQSIKTVSPQLAKDIKDLVYSLGGRANINIDDWALKNTNNGNRYYQVNFYISDIKLQNKVKRKSRKNNPLYSSNDIKISITKQKSKMVYGFLLDSPSHMFITNEWCCTYNSGKTTFGGTICKYLDPTFPGELINEKTPRRHPERIVFTAQQFSEAVAKSKPKQAILFDEAILALMAGDAGLNIQKMLMKEITLIRKKQLYIILIIPSIFSMRMPIAVQRSRFLIHTYSPDGIKRGYFKFYNYPTKRQLYMKGKRDYNQDAVEQDFRGTFVDTETLFYDAEEYDKKKEEAIRQLAESGSKSKVQGVKEYKTEGQRNLLLSYIYSLLEGNPVGKEHLEYVVQLHNEYAAAVKPHDKLNPRKFRDFLNSTFGEHIDISDATIRQYLQAAENYASKPVDPLQAIPHTETPL